MNKMRDYRKLFLITGVLFLISFSALVTVLVGNFSSEVNSVNASSYGRGFSYVRTQLGFSEKQQNAYDSLLSEYENRTMRLKVQLMESQVAMLEEISKQDPDTVFLDQISDEACRIQSGIRHHTFRHLIEVSQLATEEQKEGLNLLFREMLTDTKARHGQMQGKGKGSFRNRHRRN
jgi:hypothetical protein